jgi:hypothetical protein
MEQPKMVWLHAMHIESSLGKGIVHFSQERHIEAFWIGSVWSSGICDRLLY